MLKTLLLLAILSRPAEVTAYCSCEKCCGEWADGITASGHVLQDGDLIVAAPKNYKFGTTIYISNYGLAKVEDRGGAITGNRFDVWFSSHEKALEFGRQKTRVLIWEN